LTFQDTRLRLLAYVRNQVRNGELTERGFARRIGISQPHAHNVLKGVRTLSPEIFDLILKYLHLSLLDLATVEEIEVHLERRRTRGRVAEVAFTTAPIGPGRPWPTGVNRRRSFPVLFPSITVPAQMVMAELKADPAMLATLAPYDIALLDTSTRARCAITPQGLYVVERGGEAVLRYIRSGAHRHYLVTDVDLNQPTAWEPLALSVAQLGSAVKARVLWLGSERDRHALPQRDPFLYDPISW
jgi:hypothetical protein